MLIPVGAARTRVTLYTFSWRYPDEEIELRAYARWDVLVGPREIDWEHTALD